jgi:hypothetical protein
MGYASKAGRARASSVNPQAFGVCQRCGEWYNRVDLIFQFQWRGAAIQNTYKLVCKRCLDIPQEQLRAITLPADPVPVFYPSVEDFDGAEIDYRGTSQPDVIDPVTGIPIPQTALRITQDCHNRVTTPFGERPGLDQRAVTPLSDAVPYGVPLSILSVTSNNTATVQVTCSKAHGLQPDSQVVIQGLANPAACGAYSVNPITAMAFTYQTYGSIPSAALLTPTTRIITCKIGLPRGFLQIPKINGPTLNPMPPMPVAQQCYFALENGTGVFLLENGSGMLDLETCQNVAGYFFETENGQGVFLLEDGTDYLELENGP